MGSLAGIGVDKLVGYLPIFLGHTHMQGDITRDYAVLEPVRLRWKIIRRNVCTAVGILLSGFIFLNCFQCLWCAYLL